MRKLVILSVAALIAACTDNQQPTSPVNGTESRSATTSQLNQLAQTNGKQPGAVAFTKATAYEGPTVTIPGGTSDHASLQCPSGSVATGGGYEESGTPGGTAPKIFQSFPYQNGWWVGVDNTQAGAAIVTVHAFVVCAS